jgi:hypothetical protein
VRGFQLDDKWRNARSKDLLDVTELRRWRTGGGGDKQDRGDMVNTKEDMWHCGIVG